MGGIGEEAGGSAVWRWGMLQGVEKYAWTRTVLNCMWSCGEQGFSAAEDVCFTNSHKKDQSHVPQPETIECFHA